MIYKLKYREVITVIICLCIISFVATKFWREPISSDDRLVLIKNQEVTIRSIYIKDDKEQLPKQSLKRKDPKHSESVQRAFKFQNGKWKLINLCEPYKSYLKRPDFPLIKFVSDAGKVKIFTHSLDDGISHIINKTGAFEVETINRILYELKKDKRLNLIDIGSNIGQHSIAAALIGRNAIAIDGATSNLVHLCASMQYLNITNRITMINNMISDSHEKLKVRYSANNDDFGNTYVETDGIQSKMMSVYEKKSFSNTTIEQEAVTLDDLLKLPIMHRFKKVFIKLDVEGHEHRVLLGGKKFFESIHISGIIMEWAWHVNRTTGVTIRQFLRERGFTPYKIPRSKSRTQVDISNRDPDEWPQDVLWLPDG